MVSEVVLMTGESEREREQEVGEKRGGWGRKENIKREEEDRRREGGEERERGEKVEEEMGGKEKGRNMNGEERREEETKRLKNIKMLCHWFETGMGPQAKVQAASEILHSKAKGSPQNFQKESSPANTLALLPA